MKKQYVYNVTKKDATNMWAISDDITSMLTEEQMHDIARVAIRSLVKFKMGLNGDLENDASKFCAQIINDCVPWDNFANSIKINIVEKGDQA